MESFFYYVSPIGGLTGKTEEDRLVGLWLDGQKFFGEEGRSGACARVTSLHGEMTDATQVTFLRGGAACPSEEASPRGGAACPSDMTSPRGGMNCFSGGGVTCSDVHKAFPDAGTIPFNVGSTPSDTGAISSGAGATFRRTVASLRTDAVASHGCRRAGVSDRLTAVADTPAPAPIARWLDCYFSGKDPGELPPLAFPAVSPFRRRVWELLCRIPYGKLVTYGDISRFLACETGRRISAQAVGGAVGHNPISVIVPCHRVVGSDGGLTGYAGGTDKKIALLRTEGVDTDALAGNLEKYRFVFS